MSHKPAQTVFAWEFAVAIQTILLELPVIQEQEHVMETETAQFAAVTDSFVVQVQQ